MTAYRVVVNQTINGKDATFSEYVKTLQQAAYTIERFNDTEDDRYISSITIETIWIVD